MAIPDPSQVAPWYLRNINQALELDETTGNVFVRTGLASGGNIIITGNVTIPGEIDTHITAIGSLGNITTPYMPIGGNVIVSSGNITAVVSGTVAVSSIAANVTVVDGGGSITVDGNVNANITGGNVATTIGGTNLDAFGRLRVSNPYTLFDSQNLYVDGGQFSNVTATGGSVTYVLAESSFNLAVSAANGLNNTSALLIAAYRIKPTMRIGAYADQNLSVNNTGSTVNLVNSSPLIGLFGVWNQRIDGTGTEVKVSAAYGQKNTTVNRQIVGLSEAGTGSSNLNSQGAQITAKYGFVLAPDMLVSPYVGMRYTRNNMGGYTEATSSAVTASLTYSALNTNATTALAGAEARYRGIPNTTLFASAGLETDINTANGTYSATGVTGLTPVNFNPNPVKTRPTATVGVYYDITKSQRFSVTGIYRQEPFQAVSTTTVLATYTIGF